MINFSRVVPLPDGEGELRAHLFLWHLEYTGDVHDVAGLVECHEAYAHGTDSPPVQTHTHSAPEVEAGFDWGSL